MYNKGENTFQYVDKNGEVHNETIDLETDMSKPQVILMLKEKDKNFFKLLENKRKNLISID